MNFNTPVRIALPLLKEFVREAKSRAFAATDVKSTLPDQTSVYSYRPFGDPKFAGMIYADTYRGNTIEGGQESISIDLVLRWRNQYYGGIKRAFWDVSNNLKDAKNFDPALRSLGPRFPEAVSSFLKLALRKLPPEFPVRGPKEFRAGMVELGGDQLPGEWEYWNTWRAVPLFDIEDAFVSFEGQERIVLNGTEVYWHAYHGGLIRDRYFPIEFGPEEGHRRF